MTLQETRKGDMGKEHSQWLGSGGLDPEMGIRTKPQLCMDGHRAGMCVCVNYGKTFWDSAWVLYH